MVPFSSLCLVLLKQEELLYIFNLASVVPIFTGLFSIFSDANELQNQIHIPSARGHNCELPRKPLKSFCLQIKYANLTKLFEKMTTHYTFIDFT